MVGRKQRGRNWPRGRGIDRSPGSSNSAGGRGRGTGRGRGGQGHVVTNDNDGDSTIGTFHPRNRRDNAREHGGNVTSLNGPNNYSRYQIPVRGTTIHRGNGLRYSTSWLGGHVVSDSSGPRERARIRHSDSKLRHGEASLSQLLYEDRPLLKPVVFVRSNFTPTLFLNEEEIFMPVTEAAEQDESSVPTAERIFRIFHPGDELPNSQESPSDAEELLEIDFEDLARVMKEKEVEGVTASSKKVTLTTRSVDKAENQAGKAAVGERFTIDTKPSAVRDTLSPSSHIERPEARILGEDMDDDDEIIVYVAPHPRNGKLAPNLNHPSSAAVIIPPPQADSGQAAAYAHQETDVPPHSTPSSAELIPERTLALSPPPTSTSSLKFGYVSSPVSGSPGTSRRGRYPRRTSRGRMKQRATFGLFGAIHAEVALHGVDSLQDRPDLDQNWAGLTSDESAEDGGMLVDQDVDVGAMQAFVNAMSIAGMAHVNADDLEVEARIRAEEEEEESDAKSEAESDGSSVEDDTESELPGDVHMLKPAGEGELSLGDSPFADEDESTSDEGETPNGLFQMRLERLRKRTEGRPISDVLEDELDQAFEVDEEDEDGVFAEGFFDDNEEIPRARDRMKKGRIFPTSHNGESEIEIDVSHTPERRNKNASIPEELHDQWERDRAKKAERKRLRDLERMAAALDPFTRKGGKKAHKARQAAALAAPVTLETLVGNMRRFVADVGGARTLPLPPMDREMRKSVHELAEAFKLKSKSRGKGVGRFTTLIKTTLSGVMVNDKKVTQILGGSAHRGGRSKGRAGGARPRDGEVVGEAAPKLDGSNIGFRMLSAMGWEEGHQIGVIGGLEVPLVAVIKTTKLGLGASTPQSRG